MLEVGDELLRSDQPPALLRFEARIPNWKLVEVARASVIENCS